MKIAITLNTSWNIYNFRMGLVRSFLSKGYEVIAIAPEDEYSELLIQEGCTFIPIQMENKGSNPVSDLKLFFQLLRIYKKNKPDIVLQFTIKPNIYGSLAAYFANIPVINNVSGLGTVFIHNNWVSKIARLLIKISFKYPSLVFFQNEDDQKLFIEKNLIDKNRSKVIPGSGVNLEKFNPVAFRRNEPFIFLVIARLLYDKGVVEYLKAAKYLKERGIKARFQLMGSFDESHLGVKRELIEQYINAGVIEYIPFQKNILPFMAEADCIVLPSYREGTPKTLLEGAALAKPLVATDVPGCKDVVKQGENGFLCLVKNSEDLAKKMERIYASSDEDLIQMGRNSRELVVLKYDEKIVIKAYEEAIINAVNSRKSARIPVNY